MVHKDKIVILGLGYVGLPLAVALARHHHVIGFDIDKSRVNELRQGHDRTGEVDAEVLRSSLLHATTDMEEIRGADLYIVTVPTPVTDDQRPDLSPLDAASRTVGKVMHKGAIVVYESTVYPGVTEDFCAPILEEVSGLQSGKDFFLGYSPERANPGDREHTVETITKVIAGQTPAVAAKLHDVYGSVNGGNLFVAKNIRTAEAAKVIENAQRDINIAFVNEIAMIFSKMGISVHDVLEAAGTKWNFLKFQPGLVGGHCIGVDPYYLATAARDVGHEPRVILSGRATNEEMAGFIASTIDTKLQSKGRILMLGLTFKEDVPDLRNTKVVDIKDALERLGHTVEVHDPLADPKDAEQHYGISLLTTLDTAQHSHAVVGAVPHKGYLSLDEEALATFLIPGGFVFDIKGLWRGQVFDTLNYWTL